MPDHNDLGFVENPHADLGFVASDDLGFAPSIAPPPSMGEAFQAGISKGLGDRVLSRAEALQAQKAPLPQDLPTRSMAEQLIRPQPPSRPVDEAKFQADAASILTGRRARGAAAAEAHPVAHGAGALVPAAASMLIPGAAGVKGAAAISGALGLAGSESDNPAELAGTGVLSTVLGGTFAKGLQMGGKALGSALAPKAQAIYDRIMTKIADRSANGADATLRSAVGTLGKATSAGSADLKLLDFLREQGVSSELGQKITQALSGPESAALRESLGANAVERLPESLSRIQGARGLVEQAGADAAAARSPAAVAATEQAMRKETASRLLTRYALPAAAGGLLGGPVGVIAGFGARPMLRATVRGLTSPAFQAPLMRMILGHVGGEGAGRLAPLAEAEAEPRLLEMLRMIQQKSSPATIAQADQQ